MQYIRLKQNNKKKTLHYEGAVMPLCKFVKFKKKKTVMIIPLFIESGTKIPQLDSIDKDLIKDHFKVAWGGHYHVMFLPNSLVKYHKALTGE